MVNLAGRLRKNFMKKMNARELWTQTREVLRLSLPAILTQITTIAMQYIDSAMVGALGANASASIGLVASSTWLFGGIVGGVSAGFSVQASHCVGAEDDRGARCIVRHGLAAGLSIALLLCLIGVLICPVLPRWLHGDEAIREGASAYFFAFALMLPFSQLNSLCSSFLQSAGDMVTPSVLNAAMCGFDVLFNALLIPRFGVFGAGLGTALACAVVSLLMAWRCLFRDPILRIDRKEKDKLHPAILKKAFRIGCPVALQEVFLCAAMVVSTRIIAPLGAVSVAANSFAVTAEGFCYMPGFGLGAAAATLVGRSIGAGRGELAKAQGNICIALGALFMAAAAGLMMLLCPWVFRLLTPDSEVQALSVRVLRIGLLAEPLYGVSIVAAGALRGTGDTLVPSLMNLASIWIVRLGLALLLVGKYGLPGMWTAMAAELCVRGLLLLTRQLTTKYYAAYKKEPT